MEISHYSQLEEAIKKDVEAFQKYELECRGFIARLRQSLINYLGCPTDRVEWLQFAVDQSFEQNPANNFKKVSFDQRLLLQEDARYYFIFQVKFDTEHVNVPFRVKKFDSHFQLQICQENFEVSNERLREIDHITERLFILIMEFLDTRFENFVNVNPSDFGFTVLINNL